MRKFYPMLSVRCASKFAWFKIKTRQIYIYIYINTRPDNTNVFTQTNFTERSVIILGWNSGISFARPRVLLELHKSRVVSNRRTLHTYTTKELPEDVFLSTFPALNQPRSAAREDRRAIGLIPNRRLPMASALSFVSHDREWNVHIHRKNCILIFSGFVTCF